MAARWLRRPERSPPPRLRAWRASAEAAADAESRIGEDQRAQAATEDFNVKVVAGMRLRDYKIGGAEPARGSHRGFVVDGKEPLLPARLLIGAAQEL
jgi:hypothetical protein